MIDIGSAPDRAQRAGRQRRVQSCALQPSQLQDGAVLVLNKECECFLDIDPLRFLDLIQYINNFVN
jgi:hypothetical protein